MVTFDSDVSAIADATLPSMGEPTSSHVRHGHEVLDDLACLSMLAGGGLGRVGLTIDALPTILPVDFALVHGDVIIRTRWGAKARAAADRQVVCFEVDGHDDVRRVDWSVVVVGRAEIVSHPDRIAQGDHLLARRWDESDDDCFVRVRTEFLSGRRVPARRHPAARPVGAE